VSILVLRDVLLDRLDDDLALDLSREVEEFDLLRCGLDPSTRSPLRRSRLDLRHAVAHRAHSPSGGHAGSAKERSSRRRTVRYVALLRGIAPMNPNMRNEKLRAVVADLGFGNAQTVISSGNVVFDADRSDMSEVESRLEHAWAEQLGLRSTTIVRSHAQIEELVASNPFGGLADTPTASQQVTFLKREPEMTLVVPYVSPAGDYSIVAVHDRAICSVVDLTARRTPDLMRSLERMVGKEITTRTWKTVHRIRRKLS
jgi:uncharacterized protein (DUF1697 family)